MKRISNVLEDLTMPRVGNFVPREAKTQALSQIKQIILESLPREIYSYRFAEKSYNQGYNQAIADMKKRIEEIC